MAKKKRITRKQLLKEPDEFLTFSRRLIRFAVEYKTQISLILGVLCILILAGLGIQYFLSKSESRAFVMLEQGVTRYKTILKESGPDRAYREVEKDFQMILKKYSGNDGGKLARVTYANICYNGGDTDRAIVLYNKAVDDFHDNLYIKHLILCSLGYCHEKKKDYNTAAKYFAMIASKPDAIMKDEALFNLGRLYSETGDNTRSMEAFKKILSDYTDSIYIELVRERLAGVSY